MGDPAWLWNPERLAGPDPAVCRQIIADLRRKTAENDEEAEILQQAEDDVVPLSGT